MANPSLETVRSSSLHSAPLQRGSAPAKQGVLGCLVQQVSKVWFAFLSLLDYLTCGLFSRCLKRKTVASNRGEGAGGSGGKIGNVEQEQAIERALSRFPVIPLSPEASGGPFAEHSSELPGEPSGMESPLLDPECPAREIYQRLQCLFAQGAAFTSPEIERCVDALLLRLLEEDCRDQEVFKSLSDSLDLLLPRLGDQVKKIDFDYSLIDLVKAVGQSAEGGVLPPACALNIIEKLFNAGARFTSSEVVISNLSESLDIASAPDRLELFSLIVSHHSALLSECVGLGEVLRQVAAQIAWERQFLGMYQTALAMLSACGRAELYGGVESVLCTLCTHFMFKEVRDYLEGALRGRQIAWERADLQSELLGTLAGLLRTYPTTLPGGESTKEEERVLPPLTQVTVLLIDSGLKMGGDALASFLEEVIEAGYDDRHPCRSTEGLQLLELLLLKVKDEDNQEVFKESFSTLVEKQMSDTGDRAAEVSRFLLVAKQIEIFEEYAVPLRKEALDKGIIGGVLDVRRYAHPLQDNPLYNRS